MKYRVLKYGGSSVSTIEKIEQIASYLAKQNEKIIIVVSAMGKTTNKLLEMAALLDQKMSNLREIDSLLTTGEHQTAALMALALTAKAQTAISLTGFQAGIKTNGVHTKNIIESIDKEKLNSYFQKYDYLVIAGFQGINENGDLTTFGRGGSDTTAVALATQFETIAEIYTDVEGIYGIDPRIYPKAQKISQITFDEMMELAVLGSKVMETRAVELGKKFSTPIYVGKTLSKNKGTLINNEVKMLEQKVISGISINEDIINTTIKSPNLKIEKIFNIIAQNAININMIAYNNQNSLSFTANATEENAILTALNEYEINIDEKVATVSVVGIGMISSPGTTAKVINIASQEGINISQITTSEISITLLVEMEKAKKLAAALAKEFGV